MVEFPSPDNLRRQVEDIREVATLPHVMLRILEVVSNDNASAEDLSGEIAADASLTAKILKIVNSAYYGFYREIALLTDAVVVLGFEEIKRISLAMSVLGMFGDRTTRDQARMAFWEHSFHTAAMAELLERDLGRGGRGAFTAGLLHDIGRAVLDQSFPDLHQAIVANERDTVRTAAVVEQELLGTTHAEIGFWLAERWNLPQVLSEAIRYHHAPTQAVEGAMMAATVHVADVLVHRLATTEDEAGPERPLADAALTCLGVSVAQLEEMQAAAGKRIAKGQGLVAELLAP